MLVEHNSHRLPRSCHAHTCINMCIHIHVHIYTYVRCISLLLGVVASHWCALSPFQISGGRSTPRLVAAVLLRESRKLLELVEHTLLSPFHHSEKLTWPSLATEGQGIVVL